MASCEPYRSSAYSDDIRWRIVWQRHALGRTHQAIATNVNVDVSTVRRILDIFSATGTVSKKAYPAEKAFRKISEPVQLFILHLLLEKPGIYLHEITANIKCTLGLDLTESAVCKFLSRIGFTRQRLATYALQRDEDLRHQYVADVSLYAQDTLIFIDETGTNRTDTVRKFGYSLRGKPIRAQKLVVHGEHVSAIAAISTRGLLALKIVRGGVDGDMFYDFVCTELLPKLMPFNGSNHNSVLLLDNCSIHHVPELQQVFRDAQVLTHYLPPYSPDYNPIELAFSKVKYLLKAMEAEMQALQDIDTILLAAFSQITAADCCAWISSIGIY